VWSCRVPELGLLIVGVTSWSGEGVGSKSLEVAFGLRKSNPCDRCPPLPFIVARGGAQGEVKKRYSAWLLVRPVIRRCPSGRIEAKL
jgi:hypothetical protein